MFRNKIILLFFFCYHSFSAQTIKIICGQLFDSDNKQSITGAIIQWDSKTFTTSDKNGFFCLKTNSIKGQLSVSMVGYKSKAFEIEKTDSDSVFLSLSLNIDAMLDEVVISAGRFEQKQSQLTVSLDLIKPQLIQQKNTTQLDQIVAQVSGVTVNDGQASIRGGSGFSYGAGSRVLVLLDELPMISADAGDIKWTFMPIETVDQIEVIKGASSVLYGSGALNGVIHLRTRYARDKPFTQITSFFGSYDAPRNTYKWWKGTSQFQQGIQLAHAQKIGPLDLVIGGQWFNDDGYRFLEHETRGRFNSQVGYQLKKIPGLSFKLNSGLMQNKGGLFFLWQNFDSALIPQGRNLQNYINTRYNIDPSVHYLSKNGLKINWRNRYFVSDNKNDKNQSSFSALYYTELQVQKKISKHTFWNSGLVMNRQVIKSDSLYGKHIGSQMAHYHQLDAEIGTRLNITVGLRLEWAKLDDAQSNYNWFGHNLPLVPVMRGGLNYKVFESSFARASFGQGYRFPTSAEKFISTSLSVLKIFPNPNLKPETGQNFELGYKQFFKTKHIKGFADLAGFWSRYDNLVEFVFNYYNSNNTLSLIERLNYYGFKSENIGKADIKGIELSANAEAVLGSFTIQIMGGYTFIEPRKQDFNSALDTLGLREPYLKESDWSVLKYRNRHLYKQDIQIQYKKFSFGWSSRFQSATLNIDNRFVRPIFEELGNGFESPDAPSILPGMQQHFYDFSKSFWVHDARLSYTIAGKIKLAYIVNNLSNTAYQSRPGDWRPPTLHQFQITFTPAYKN